MDSQVNIFKKFKCHNENIDEFEYFMNKMFIKPKYTTFTILAKMIASLELRIYMSTHVTDIVL